MPQSCLTQKTSGTPGYERCVKTKRPKEMRTELFNKELKTDRGNGVKLMKYSGKLRSIVGFNRIAP